MVTNTKNVDEPYCRSTLRGSEDLPELKRCGSRRRLSGPGQGDAAAGSMKIRGATAAAAAEARAEERQREEEEGECEKKALGRPIYKAES